MAVMKPILYETEICCVKYTTDIQANAAHKPTLASCLCIIFC